MICKRGGFVIQRHNELRDLQADLLSTVCSDVEVEPVLQEGPIEFKTQDWTFGRWLLCSTLCRVLQGPGATADRGIHEAIVLGEENIGC